MTEEIKFLVDILKDRPDLFFTVALLIYSWMERNERKSQQKINSSLVDKMHEQNTDTQELLGQIKLLLEILTRGRV